MLNEMREKYRQIRREVYENSTKPINCIGKTHTANKSIFQTRVTNLCENANLGRWNEPTHEARTALWNHLWTKNRYAGIAAQIATNEISQLTPLFDDYAWFTDSDWDIKSKGFTVQSSGKLIRNFIDKTGPFKGISTIANIPKLKKLVTVARSFNSYFLTNPNAPAIEFVTRKLNVDDTWSIHNQLLDIGYTADLTALHFMMDTGFQVIKPDVVITRLFLDLGWLHHAIKSLPNDLTRQDLIGKGTYGTKYHYTKPKIYKPVIDLANEIVKGIQPQQLSSDIGWVTSNPIREFDIFIVKAGQLPEKEFGIERRLYD